MANAAALRVRPGDLASLWESEREPDLILDTDDGSIRPIRRDGGEVSRITSLVSGVGKAVVTAAPAAAGVVLSEVSRWD